MCHFTIEIKKRGLILKLSDDRAQLCTFKRPPPSRQGPRLMGMFADFAFMIYLLFMHDNIDSPLRGLISVVLLPKLQS